MPVSVVDSPNPETGSDVEDLVHLDKIELWPRREAESGCPIKTIELRTGRLSL
jgi:hypothetical protein